MTIIILKYSKVLLAALLIFFTSLTLHAQQKLGSKPAGNDKKLVQVSGIITTMATGKSTPVPYVIVRIKNSFRGTIAGVDGFYSIPAQPHDTLDYYAIGFKRQYFIIQSNN